jgi:hypothetical protein
MLASMVEGHEVEAPAGLVAHFPEALRRYAIAASAANEPMEPELFPR